MRIHQFLFSLLLIFPVFVVAQPVVSSTTPVSPATLCVGETLLVAGSALNPGSLALTWNGAAISPLSGNSANDFSVVVPASPIGAVTLNISTGVAPDVTVNVTINDLDDATFEYPVGQNCWRTAPFTLVPNNPGGWDNTFGSTIAPGGTGLASADGSIDKSALPNTTTTYTVNGMTNGNCPVALTGTVTVTLEYDAGFSYAALGYCQPNTDNPVNPTNVTEGAADDAWGFMAIAPPTANLFLNTGNGNIRPYHATTTAGLYQITRTVTPTGGCTSVHNLNVTVHDEEPAFTYQFPTLYTCDAGTHMPMGSFSAGGTFTEPTGNLTMDAAGVITPSTSTPGATYTVTHTTLNCAETATFDVTIESSPVATFNYIGTNYCQNDNTVISPSGAFSGGGTWSITAGAGAGFTSGSGVGAGDFDPSNMTAGGPYTVTHTISPTGCTPVAATDVITIDPDRDSSFTYSKRVFCVTDAPPLANPTVSSDISQYAFVPLIGGDVLMGWDNLTGQFDPATSDTGAYTITSFTNPPCVESDTFQIRISSLDDASFNYSQSFYCPTGSASPLNIDSTYLGTFSINAIPPGPIAVDLNGVIDLAASDTGVYRVRHVSGGACMQTHFDTVTIYRLTNPIFDYSLDTFCINVGPTVTSLFPTDPGLFNGAYISGTGPSISVSNTTGELDPSSSNEGRYEVTYTTSHPCPQMHADTVDILSMDVAAFAYNMDTACQNASPFTNITAPALGFNRLFTNISGHTLGLTTANGQINMFASTGDTTHLVEMTFTNAPCPLPTRDSIYINAPDSGSINYGMIAFCEDTSGSPGPLPMVNFPGGYFFSVPILPSLAPDSLMIDTSNGEVILNGSDAGSYRIFFQPPGNCVELGSLDVTFDTLPNPFFSYAATAFCVSDPAELPDSITSPGGGGIFSVTPSGLGLNQVSGLITPGSSIAGVYILTYTTPGTCPQTSSIPITITSSGIANFSYPTNQYCTGSLNPLPNMQGTTPGGYFVSVPDSLTFVDDADTSFSGQIDLSVTNGGTYDIIYTTPGCEVTHTFTVNILPGDDPSFDYPIYRHCYQGVDTILVNPPPTSGGNFREITGTLNVHPNSGYIALMQVV